MDGNAAEQTFANGELVAPFGCYYTEDFHGFAGDFGANPVTRKH